ncbi:hypothetical protein F909_01846 [Acinetobacter sp. ANC 3929]|uniref:hypothetical protein n=1 Tax=Acinetobacter TaxID=469 RepID=UPI0002CE26CA|nr:MULTISPECIES: hypothetical protein [Acinetobacter]ENW80560.1 hypothetical protein F909_01846 [Acinetobacter sp. ANC 3929]MCH7354041.1 hypothetical protein [Acinetobacter sp. NIPH 1958]WEI17321.1 hypothetical protein PY247_12505 [Acinetobacter proteolyticus]
MEILTVCKNISEKIQREILLKWVGKKELTTDDTNIIVSFAKDYSNQIFSKAPSELIEIIFSIIYVPKDKLLIEKVKSEVFDEISSNNPLLFQGMSDFGEKPKLFANNILLLAITKLFENEILEKTDISKLLILSESIKFISFYNPKRNEENEFSQDFIDILLKFHEEIISEDWKDANLVAPKIENLFELQDIVNPDEESDEGHPVEQIQNENIEASSANIIEMYNALSSFRNISKNFYQQIINKQNQYDIEQDLLWWLNVSHTKKYPNQNFYSYKLIENPFLSSAFMVLDLCSIESLNSPLILPLPDKVKALLLESIYKCFPEVLKEKVILSTFKEIEKDEFNVLPEIDNIRYILSILEKFCDIDLEVSVPAFSLQMLSLVQSLKLGLVK